MSSIWAELLPLAVACMVVPVQWTLTIVLLRASRVRALAFLAGNVGFRLAQGLLFFALVPETHGADPEPSSVVAWSLLVVGVLLLVKAARSLIADAPDDDAPPPRWLESASTLSTPRAFVVGAGLLAIGAKFWVFTMSAVAVIDYADLSTTATAVSFLTFAVLAVLPPLLVVAMTVVAPARSETLLDAASVWLTRNTATIVLGICLVVGTWFVVKALTQLVGS